MKHSLACASALTLSLALQSQTDTLVTPRGQKVSVIITEITTSDIIYKLPDKPNLPPLHFKRNNLEEIILNDGSSVDPKFNTVNPFDKLEQPKARTIVSFIPTKLFQNHIGFAYEHIFRKNVIGIRIPVSVSLADGNSFNRMGLTLYENDLNRRFTAGIDVNVYPLRLGKFKYTTGIGLMYAPFRYQVFNGYNYTPVYRTENGLQYSFVINNGFIAQPTKHLVISGTMGLGIQYETGRRNDFMPRLNTTVHVGYLF
ncbi:MAG: hypothetical protein O9353_13170 [Bacteroidia bacterium]|nr:hypothetical protein [Bacteroidia bacterium]